MHYGMLLLAMCMVCVYGAPRLQSDEANLRKYMYHVENTIEREAHVMFIPFEENIDNSSKSNSEVKIKKSADVSLSTEEKDDNSAKSKTESEDLSSQEDDLSEQLNNEIQAISKIVK